MEMLQMVVSVRQKEPRIKISSDQNCGNKNSQLIGRLGNFSNCVKNVHKNFDQKVHLMYFYIEVNTWAVLNTLVDISWLITGGSPVMLTNYI